MKYTCYIKEGYLFAEIEGLGIAFIDSGSPGSISEQETATIGGRDVRFNKNVLGQTANTISLLLDTEIDALIGSDILSKFEIFIDIAEGYMSLTEEPLRIEGIKEKVEYPLYDIPVLTCKIGDTDYRFILDLGARLSYIDSELAEKFSITGESTDFFPSFGRFKTETRKMEVEIAGQKITLNFGTLPEILELTLTLAQADGIIGTELLDYFNVGISRQGKTITYQRVE